MKAELMDALVIGAVLFLFASIGLGIWMSHAYTSPVNVDVKASAMGSLSQGYIIDITIRNTGEVPVNVTHILFKGLTYTFFDGRAVVNRYNEVVPYRGGVVVWPGEEVHITIFIPPYEHLPMNKNGVPIEIIVSTQSGKTKGYSTIARLHRS